MTYLESSQQPFPAGENLYRSVLVGIGGFFVKGKDDALLGVSFFNSNNFNGWNG